MITIIRHLPRVKWMKPRVVGRCHCGREYELNYHAALRAKSCGCGRGASLKGKNVSHGYSNHYLYGTWGEMIRRCYSEQDQRYPSYGGRGIRVFSRWHDVANFIEDLIELIGDRPKDHTLDRLDNDGDYEPTNVKWSTKKEQARNTRSNRLVTICGVSKCAIEWAEEYEIKHSAFLDRLERGITGTELLKPMRKMKPSSEWKKN